MAKRALVVSPASPPAGGSHATRIAALVEALRVGNFEVDLLTVAWDETQKSGSGQFQRILELATVHEAGGGMLRRTARAVGQMGSHPGWRQRLVQRLRAFTRSQMIPDSYATWIPNAVSLGNRICKNKPFDLIISSGAPFSAHIAAYAISRRAGVPLALDYGDPWVFEPGRPRKGIRLLLERNVERTILNHARVVSVTTKPTIDLYRDRYPDIAAPVILAPMGFDNKDFNRPLNLPAFTETRAPLRLAYTGRINEEYRSVGDLAKCLDGLGTDLPEFCIEFFGSEFGSIRNELRKYQEMGLIKFREPVDHSAYIDILRSYDGLILFGNNNAIQIPGKLADYLAAQNMILYFPNIPDDSEDPTLRLARDVQSQGVFVGRRNGEFARFLEACKRRDLKQDKNKLQALEWNNCFWDLINHLEFIAEPWERSAF
jgi:hypothetical protein